MATNALGITLVIVITATLLWAFRWRTGAAAKRLVIDDAMRAFLRDHVDFYAELSAEERARFEREVTRFLKDHVITGPRGAEVSDETRLLVAASAVILVFGIKGFVYPSLRDIVVYPTAFDRDYEVDASAQIAGMVHARGPILFSERDLRLGFKRGSDGYNVGLHEFAHVLDFKSGDADGVPGILPWKLLRPWLRIMAAETAKVEARRSVLRDYAATNEAEFFAVATEAFFERPHALKDRHPKLYELLATTYRQDPAVSERLKRR